jgi:hypothetical protein
MMLEAVEQVDISKFLISDDYDQRKEEAEDKEWLESSAQKLQSFEDMLTELRPDQLAQQLTTWNLPSAWAETYLNHPDDPAKPLELKNFQTTIINDWHPNVVLRIGRQQGKSVVLCCRAIWYCMRHPNKTFLIATPTRAQVWRLFEAVSNLAYNLILQEQIKVTRGNPMIVRFPNGSKIVGFTVGTKSGRKAFGVRGQMADVLALDEADLMSEGDVSTLYAIKNNLKEKLHFWMSSTPTGERKQFYTACTKANELGYHHYHFRPEELPGYNAETDKELRQMIPLDEYEHEILAEFGSIAAGVFRTDLLEDAMDDKSMPPFIDGVLTTYDTAKYLPVNEARLYTIGVDWNTASVGQAITVMEWNIQTKKARIWLQEEIPGKLYSHSDAVNRIIQLTKLLDPDTIAVDHGFGDADIERLRMADDDHVGLNMKNRLMVVNFGVDIEIEDPMTREIVRKDAKPLVINSTVMLLENHMLSLPKVWDTKNRLIDDMRHYMIMRKSEAGSTIYTKTNDHRIISFCLANFAISLKGNILIPGRTGAVERIVMKNSDIWSTLIDKHPSASRTSSIESINYFNKSSKKQWNSSIAASKSRESSDEVTIKQFKKQLAGGGKPILAGRVSWANRRAAGIPTSLVNTPFLSRSGRRIK